MIRDRDRVYGIAFRSRIKAMGIEEVVTAPAIAVAVAVR